jgi:hypothetical protein
MKERFPLALMGITERKKERKKKRKQKVKI